jgi:hypothetical protein
MKTVSTDDLVEAVASLLEEVYVGPPNPKATWITTNEANTGFLGTLSEVPAEVASQAPARGMNTIAAHAEHLRYALSLANRAMAGESPYAQADWAGSWRARTLDAAGWARLREEIRREHQQLLASIRARTAWEDADMLKGVLALVGHGAYHLGAVRQLLRMLSL